MPRGSKRKSHPRGGSTVSPKRAKHSPSAAVDHEVVTVDDDDLDAILTRIEEQERSEQLAKCLDHELNRPSGSSHRDVLVEGDDEFDATLAGIEEQEQSERLAKREQNHPSGSSYGDPIDVDGFKYDEALAHRLAEEWAKDDQQFIDLTAEQPSRNDVGVYDGFETVEYLETYPCSVREDTCFRITTAISEFYHAPDLA